MSSPIGSVNAASRHSSAKKSLNKAGSGRSPKGPTQTRPETELEASNVDSDAWACDVLLRDGLPMHIRALRAIDREGIVALHERSSAQTHYFRFFNAMPHLNEGLLDRLTILDQHNRVAIVAENGQGICAVGRYDRTPGSPVAEVAFVVDDPNQGRGISTILLEHLAEIASAQGVERFEAMVLAENRAMIGVFRSSGFATTTASEDLSTRMVTLDLQPTLSATEARHDRDAVATIASLRRLLKPKSVAVIGASNRVGTPGNQIVRNLTDAGFQGDVYAINPSETMVCGQKSYPTVTDVGMPIDIAIVVVRGSNVEAVVEQCAAAGVASLVIVSAGFAELGAAGKALQESVVILARKNGMRIVGPNCLGIANTEPAVSLNATFASMPIPDGSVGVMTQSGAIGLAILDGLAARGLGVSSFVSVGNKADISGNDLLTYWGQDSATKQIVLYLESFGNPRSFARIAAEVAKTKPIIAIKTGRTEAAATAASSHTAALALPDQAVETLLFQSGVIRVASVEQLIDVCTALDTQPLPAGPRVAIVTNAGGPGILATDTLVECGLEIAAFDDSTHKELTRILGRAVGSGPVDLRADTTPETVTEVLNLMAVDPNVDSIVIILADVSGTGIEKHLGSIGAAELSGKPILCNFVPNPATTPAHLAVFASAERAIATLGSLFERTRWLNEVAEFKTLAPLLDDQAKDSIREHVAKRMGLRPGGGWLPIVEAFALMKLAGIPSAGPVYASTSDEAVAAAATIGYPVALKSASAELLHKSDHGAVHLSLKSDFDVACAFEVTAKAAMIAASADLPISADLKPDMSAASVKESTEEKDDGVIVQPMIKPGVELIVGIANHPKLGPVVIVGEGGRLADMRHDTAMRRPPISESQARRQVQSLRIEQLLTGFRGSPRINEDALVDVIMRLGELAELVPEISAAEINPLIATDTGVCAADVKIHLEPSAVPRNEVFRQLR
jgi:acyl-CoA synthetase (NDP forming)/L-amino acid N-acyltransferase YncA